MSFSRYPGVALSFRADAFEYAPDPAFIVDVVARSVVATNARARGLLGGVDPKFSDLVAAPTGEGIQAPVDHRLRLQVAGGVLVMDGVFSRFGNENALWLLTLRVPARESAEVLARSGRMELMGQLARGVAHDFKNVLQAISLARDEIHQFDPGSDLVLRGVGEALSLGGDLLATLHALSTDGQARRRRVSVTDVLRRCETLIRMLSRMSARVSFDLEEDPLFVQADEGQLVQLVMSLAMHARDAVARTGGTIAFSAQRAGAEEVRISVRHDGLGVAPDSRGSVFDGTAAAEFQVTASLGTVRYVVARLGGQISVVSPLADQRGAEFRVSLPRSERVHTPASYAASAFEVTGPRAVVTASDVGLVGLLRRAAELWRMEVGILPLEDVRVGRYGRSSSLALWLIDLDDVARSPDSVSVLARAMALHERVRVPLVLVAGTLEGDLRAQVSLLTARGAKLLRKPVTTAAVVQALGVALRRDARDPDAPIPRMHEAS